MSLTKVLSIKDNVMNCAANAGLEYSMIHEIEGIVADVHHDSESTYGKRDVVQLINSIEREKIRFLRGHSTLKYLYNRIDTSLDRFKMHHPKFDYRNDSVLNAYYSEA